MPEAPDSDCNIRSGTQTGYISLNRQEELYLIHHYSTITYKTISRHCYDTGLWRDTVFQDGSNYHFVLDAILAMAALHKAHLVPGEARKHTRDFLRYHEQSFRAYREQLPTIVSQHCTALLNFSMISSISLIALSQGFDGSPTIGTTQTLLAVFRLLRTTKLMYGNNLGDQWSDGHKAFSPLKCTTSTDHGNKDFDVAMSKLRQCIGCVISPPSTQLFAVYTSVIDSLHQKFKLCGQGKEIGAILSWPANLSDISMELLVRGDRTMLLILVHYGVLILQANDRWWAKGCGTRLIRELTPALRGTNDTWDLALAFVHGEASKIEGMCYDPRLSHGQNRN